MILVCAQCKSSFLISASYFVLGPRRVRCGKCRHVWQANDLQERTNKPKFPPPAQERTDKPKSPPLAQTRPQEQPFLASPSPHPGSIPQTFLHHTHPDPHVSFNPRLHLGKIGRLLLAAVTTASGLILLATLIFVLFKTPIIATWPKTLEIYYRLGLADLQPEGKIVLQNVRSRNAYRDGAMHLVVEGDIRNNAKKTQILHALQFKARGPDGAIIESWRIDPPTATLRPGAAVSFATAILSPKKTVVEVNLDFVEPPHDER